MNPASQQYLAKVRDAHDPLIIKANQELEKLQQEQELLNKQFEIRNQELKDAWTSFMRVATGVRPGKIIEINGKQYLVAVLVPDTLKLPGNRQLHAFKVLVHEPLASGGWSSQVRQLVYDALPFRVVGEAELPKATAEEKISKGDRKTSTADTTKKKTAGRKKSAKNTKKDPATTKKTAAKKPAAAKKKVTKKESNATKARTARKPAL